MKKLLFLLIAFAIGFGSTTISSCKKQMTPQLTKPQKKYEPIIFMAG